MYAGMHGLSAMSAMAGIGGSGGESPPEDLGEPLDHCGAPESGDPEGVRCVTGGRMLEAVGLAVDQTVTIMGTGLYDGPRRVSAVLDATRS